MIEVISCGPLNTVQDLGRSGYRHLGVSVSGVMDQLALRAGNLVLGNEENDAAIELQIFPCQLRFTEATDIALTGADCRATVDGRAILPWWAFRIEAGQVLSLNYPRTGTRSYLCVAGGVDVPVVMGSRSTALRGAFGGYHGRFLQKGDRLLTGNVGRRARLTKVGIGLLPPNEALRAVFPPVEDGVTPIRAIPAGDYPLFCHDGQDWWQQVWEISMDSNRTGYRLKGEALKASQTVEMRSYGLIPGIVQVPPSGEPIIQLSDANTAGGYPKIACVIEEDLWRIGQLPPRSKIRFIESDHQESIRVRKAVEQWLDRIHCSVSMMLHG